MFRLWGSNINGQLGDGPTINSTSPVPVYAGGALAGRTLTQIVVGGSSTCALDSTGAAYFWGLDTSGQRSAFARRQGQAPLLFPAFPAFPDAQGEPS
jgi:alpha-tubulin suppressor-like RCC1 family protein